MFTWIVLFRGINVVGKNILPMKELVRDLQSLNLENIKTYIQSGNAIFGSSKKVSPTLDAKIATTIENRHGFRPHVLILSLDQLEHVIESNPFPEAQAEANILHVFFLASAPTAPDLKALTKVKSPSERFHLKAHVFYLHAPNGIGRSKLAANAEKFLGVTVTARNWRTVQKLWEMAKANMKFFVQSSNMIIQRNCYAWLPMAACSMHKRRITRRCTGTGSLFGFSTFTCVGPSAR